MQLESFCVVHISKSRVPRIHPALQEWSSVFHLETCQRWIWIGKTQDLSQILSQVSDGTLYRGSDAYLFLMRLAAGLESEVVGETDIFGQMKEAWRRVSSHIPTWNHSAIQELSPWIQRIFEDTKEIRTRYLQHLGGASYGSLVRKKLRENSRRLEGPVFLVGAGQIAQSVAPLLSDFDLWIWNRDPIRLCSFSQELMSKRMQVKKLASPEEEVRGWKEAAHIVVCIPLNSSQDQARIQWFRENPQPGRSIIHLGGIREHCQDWNFLPGFSCLTDLFALQNSLGHTRSVQISLAERACEERAKLRSLGASLSIPHGWEDLACFA